MRDIIEIPIKNKPNCIIYQDYNSDFSPREWDNVGILVMLHNRYDFPNEADINKDDFDSWISIYAHIVKEYKPLTMLSLKLYDHSGLYLYSELHQPVFPSYHERFDVSKIGLIFTTEERLKALGIETRDKKELMKILDNEVKAYAHHLRGELYGYRLERLDTCKECGHVSRHQLDGCGGFYGGFKESGLLDELPKEYKKAYEEGNYEEIQ